MSMCYLRSFCVKLSRQACILANNNNKVLLPPAIASARYSSTNKDLFKMVKKRTLEARSKLQPHKYPNNQACLTQKGAEPACSSPPTIPPITSRSLQPSAIKEAPRPLESAKSEQQKAKISKASQCVNPVESHVQSQRDPDCETLLQIKKPPEFESHNKRVPECDETVREEDAECRDRDRDRDRHREQKASTSDCDRGKKENYRDTVNRAICEGSGTPAGRTSVPCSDGAGGGPADKPPKQESEAERNRKWLLWLLAALGAGGLLLWLLSRGKSKDKEGECDDVAKDGPLRIPANSTDLPKHVPYLLIGGGTASFSAFRAIKSNDPKAKVLMITNENRKPYMRPPLSKELWFSSQQGEVNKDYRFKQWTGSERSIFFEPDEFFVSPLKLLDLTNGGIAVAQGYSVKKIDPTNRVVTLGDGYEISYDECLIATGCTPKNLAVFSNAPVSVKEKIMVYRTPEDFERLKRYADARKSITIVGNGFIGSELACSLANYAKEKEIKIFQVFPEAGNMSKLLPDYLSKWTTRKVEALGVCVLSNAGVKSAQRDESAIKLTLNNGSTVITDVVVVCIGCEPNTKLASVSGLELDKSLGGFVVNAELEARRNLFVAGDACCFYDPLLGRRRVEHHDHSVVSGRLAGENMVGKKKAYTHQSMFWSDLGPEIGYEGIGLVDSSLPTVGVFALPSNSPNDRSTDNLTEMRSETNDNIEVSDKEHPPVTCDVKDSNNYGRGVVFYLKDNKIVGILLWNLFNRIGLARTIINQNKSYEDLNEVAKLFEIHS